MRAGSPSVGEQHQRQQPGDLALVGPQRAQHAGQPDRFGGQLGALQGRAGAGGIALVEDQVQHMQHDAEPVGQLRLGAAVRTDCPADLMRCLARLMRCAIVASGTK